MAAINADPQVMRYFPATQDSEQTKDFITRMQQSYADNGFCYFALETLAEKQLIGFTGLAIPAFDAPFTPCVDIGWRLHPGAWHKGYATEAAARCLQYGFKEIGLERIRAVAPEINTPSVRVMERIGMKKLFAFRHPLLEEHKQLVNCVCYEVEVASAANSLSRER